jgi:hypothetical protein
MTDTADFQAVLERIDKLLGEVDAKLKQADSAYRRGMQLLDEAEEFLGPAAVSGLKRGLTNVKHQLDTNVNQFTSSVTTARVQAGPVITMMTYDDTWLEIRDLANTVAAAIERPAKRFNHLAGPPAVKYFDMVGEQEAAARRMATLAALAASSLQDMVIAGVIYYGAIAAALGVVLGGIIAAIIGFGSVVGSPIGATAIVIVIGAVIALGAASANFFVQQEKLGTILEKEATNPGIGFKPGPTWPPGAALPTN